MFKLLPNQYIHVLDKNTVIKRIEVGPQNFFPQESEEVITGPTPLNFITLRLNTYALITNPVKLDKKGKIMFDPNGSVKHRKGEDEIRTDKQYPDPFPLYPGEVLVKIESLITILRDQALHIVCNKDFDNKKAGDEYLVYGPKIYTPRIEETIICMRDPFVITENTALKIRAKCKCKDAYGKDREAGEEWLIYERGLYLPQEYEEMVEQVRSIVLTDRKCIMVEAYKTFMDGYKIERKAGEQWLVTRQMSPSHILGVYERLVKEVYLTVVNHNQYCFINDPFDKIEKTNKVGTKVLVKGPTSFFLLPGESIKEGIKDVHVLADDEALLVEALEDIIEDDGSKLAGELWLIPGPTSFIPSISVKVIEQRKQIVLDTNEGVYIRDYRTGEVKLIKGQSYMIKEHEQLWEKHLNEDVEQIINKSNFVTVRDNRMVVSFKCPFNAAAQIYNFKTKISRVEIGPKLIMLEPDEEFSMSYLSGNTPKLPGKIKTIYTLLGPAFSSDIVKAETSDHARVDIKLSYNWKFDEEMINGPNVDSIFCVRDFIGDLCKDMGARVRGMVATLPFDVFHKSCCRTIRMALFGLSKDNHINEHVMFAYNGLKVFNVDIRRVKPSDDEIQEKLKCSVKQAIELVTKMQELDARQKADNEDLQCRIRIEQKKLANLIRLEEEKKVLLNEVARGSEVQATGMARAEESSKIEYDKIISLSDISQAKFSTTAKTIQETYEQEITNAKFLEESTHQAKIDQLKIDREAALTKITTEKFKKMIKAIGQDTLLDMAISGPKIKAQMLEDLKLKGYMIMDSTSPINLAATADGLITPTIPKEGN